MCFKLNKYDIYSVSDKIYTLVRKIGDGGFSNVYHVYDDNRKHFALKLVNLLRMDGYTDKDLMNEIELLKVMFYNDMIKNCYITIYIPI